jgi:hypothetical protein
MPASPSTSRNRSRRSYAAVIGVAVLAALATVLIALPASLATHFLPKNVTAEDLSGSVWHGSAGKLIVSGGDAGALEWRLSPAALFSLTIAADVHWVKVAFVIDASLKITPRGISARNVRGGGPLQDLADIGLPGGARGTAVVAVAQVGADAAHLSSIAGDLSVSDLSLQQVGGGADLGNYVLHFGDAAVGPDGTINGQLSDAGGPLQVQGTVAVSPNMHTGTVSGTLKERSALPDALRNQLESIAQLRGRDPQGRIPVDLEFSL